MKTLLIGLLLAAAPAFAQVPNHQDVVRDALKAGHYDLDTHAGIASFMDAAVDALHKKDKKWGHLRKRPDQTNIHGHAEDAALYLSETPGQSVAVDFIIGAGESGAHVGWGIDQPRYSKKDWLDPHEHDGAPPSPPAPPVYPPYPPNEAEVDGAGLALFSDFSAAGQEPNALMFRFAFRVAFSWLTKEVSSLSASERKHRGEWRHILAAATGDPCGHPVPGTDGMSTPPLACLLKRGHDGDHK